MSPAATGTPIGQPAEHSMGQGLEKVLNAVQQAVNGLRIVAYADSVPSLGQYSP